MNRFFLALIAIIVFGLGLYGAYTWGFTRGEDTNDQENRRLLCEDALTQRRAAHDAIQRGVLVKVLNLDSRMRALDTAVRQNCE